MASYGFCFRESAKIGGHPGKLYLRVVHGGLSRSVTMPYRIWPNEWDADGRRLVLPRSRTERRRLLEDYDESMACDLRRMEVIVAELDKRGRYTIDEIMYCYRSIFANNTLGVYAERLAVCLEQCGRERTARAYRSAAKRFIAFNGGRDITPEHITARLMSDFQQSLKSEGRSMNTISFYMRTLRAIYNKAVGEMQMPGYRGSPFANVYTGVSPTRKMALTRDELALLSSFYPVAAETNDAAVDIAGPSPTTALIPAPLRHALAMFLFCFHARGMCFVDMAYLKRSDIRGETIRYRRRKTGQQLEIAILPSMRRIINYFIPITAGSEYLFPVITDPDKEPRLQYESGLALQNQRLKKVAALVGVHKRLSTNCARHSWATVAKGEGLPLAVISEGLGHTNQKTTEIYLASLEQSVLDRASRLVSEAIDPQRQTKNGRKKFRTASVA